MSEIDRVLTRAAWRIALDSLGRRLVVCLTAAAGAMLAMRLAERVFAFIIDWKWAWVAALAMAAAAAALWTFLARPSRLVVARMVDAGAQLRETLSTALCVRGQDDPWSAAAVELAGGVARRVVVRDAVRITVPRTWWVPPALAVAFLLAGYIPQGDVLSLLSKRTRVEQQRAEIINAKAEIKAQEDKLNELLSKVDKKLAEEPKTEDPKGPDKPDDATQPQSADDLKRDQIKKLTTLDDRLNELRENDQAKAMEEMKSRLEGLRQPSGGPEELQSMAQALQKGDIKQANAEMSKLMAKAAGNQLTDEQKKQLAKALEQMAKQMEQLSKDQKELERKLAEAGLDPKLAMDPDALKKALESAQNLSPDQKKQMQQQAQANKGAGKQMSGLAQAMQKAAQGAQGSKPGASMGDMGDQLSQMEMAEEALKNMQSASDAVKQQLAQLGQSMCQGGNGSKLSQNPGQSNSWKNGPRKGPGRANGGSGRAVEAEFNLDKQKVKGPNQGGPIIGTQVLEGGEQVKGEAKQQFTEAVDAGSKAAAEAIENKQVPREYQDAVKNYFGRLEKKAKPSATPTPAPSATAPAPAPAPASDAKSPAPNPK